MPPALSVTGPYASSATIRPVIESCAMTATPIPKRPAKWFATEDPGGDHDHGRGGRLHADGEPFDDVRRVAGLGRLRDRLDRVPARARVELGDRDEQERDDEADRAPRRRGRQKLNAPPSKAIVTGMNPSAESTVATSTAL